MGAKRRHLTYSDYINDHGIIEALRVPQPPPEGQTNESWPTWHLPEHEGGPNSRTWSPGDPWPRGGRWSHHEVLFIRTHQAFEVWFAVILHELSEILLQARDRCAVTGTSIQPVHLDDRLHDDREFPPVRFPKLKAAAESFNSEFIKNRVYLMPTPGRHSMVSGRLDFPADTLRTWTASLHRVASALHVTIPFFDVLDTLAPKQFLEFRNRLAPASGFGSTQFREIEITLGLRELTRPRIAPSFGTSEPEAGGQSLPPPMLRPTAETPSHEKATSFYAHHVPADWPRLARRFREPTVRDMVYALLNGNIFDWSGPVEVDAAMDEFAALNIKEGLAPYDRLPYVDETAVGDHIDGLGEFLSHRETNVVAMLETCPLHEEQAALRDFLDACLSVDAALLRWRDRHIRFVESMIGRRPGTGGTGVNYLRSTTDAGLSTFFTHAFPCLWQAKSIIQIWK